MFFFVDYLDGLSHTFEVESCFKAQLLKPKTTIDVIVKQVHPIVAKSSHRIVELKIGLIFSIVVSRGHEYGSKRNKALMLVA